MGQQTEVYDELAEIKKSRLYHKLANIVTSGDDYDDAGTRVSDILANLRHICDDYGVDFAEEDARAYGHYIEEVGSARRAEHMQGKQEYCVRIYAKRNEVRAWCCDSYADACASATEHMRQNSQHKLATINREAFIDRRGVTV